MNFSKLVLKDSLEYYKLYDNLKDKEKQSDLFMYKNQLTTIMVHWQVTEIRSQDNKDR
jgi:hypothetical protein